MTYEPKKPTAKEDFPPDNVVPLDKLRAPAKVTVGEFMGGPRDTSGDPGGRTVYQEGSRLPRPRVSRSRFMD